MGKAPEDYFIAVKTSKLRPGMHVAALDRLWINTPFPPSGFTIRDEQHVHELRRYCTWVYIDPLKSDEPADVVVPFTPQMPRSLTPHLNDLNIGDELPSEVGACASATTVLLER